MADHHEQAQRYADRIILCGDLQPPPSAGGRGHHRIAPELGPEVPVLRGLYRAHCLRPGLSIHSADVRDLCDLTIHTLQEQSLRLVVVLDGETDVSFGQRRLGLGGVRADAAGRAGRAQAAFISLREPELFVRRGWRGKRERKVSVVFSREWLSAACGEGDTSLAALQGLCDRHLAVAHWSPAPRAVALAEQLIRPPHHPPLLEKLYLESRAIELVVESMRHLLDAAPAPSAPPPRQRGRLEEVRDLLDSGAADGLTLDDIARRTGTNVTTLQHQFRAMVGTTVFGYLRRSRLLRARHALEREGRSIIEAACIAGYTSPANFATAYRRQFGITPRQSRAGL